ncbi:topoisomerase DNA-binding C4 zinc finger domain-containing protein [Halorussus amylolyticus]|uniref:topoisomerase DNA-binding C4 zinc finger domain-containing protein n=1 Tax=Halorussus amylolyticus TaxID=1126242 RepID=UPI00104F6F47|nr:topoisomerase DNA-binding C4 zinc finger domain-containing protein [Halorussus amylolyticus]
MTETVHIYAGDCTTTYHSEADPRRQRGRVVVVHKPDDTVLVHDSNGYQPVAWLTRANAVHREQGPEGKFALVAVKDGEQLRVESHGGGERARHDATAAGIPVGVCPTCDGRLVRARGAVTCLDCDTDHGLPRDAAILDSTCDCGLPEMSVERGARFELCIDRTCESLDAAVRERFDREWSCPDCGGDLRVLRERALFLGCENYPDCEGSFRLPDAEVVGECACGLPEIPSDSGDEPRCLDGDCAETPEVI